MTINLSTIKKIPINVDNTKDIDKPISNQTKQALDTKQPLDVNLTSICTLAGNGVLIKENDEWKLDQQLAALQTSLDLRKFKAISLLGW